MINKILSNLKVGNSYDGDIAIDDITYVNTSCLKPNSTVAPPTISDLNCNFDSNNLCKWKNDPNAQFLWTLNKGSTGTILTGPSFDQ